MELRVEAGGVAEEEAEDEDLDRVNRIHRRLQGLTAIPPRNHRHPHLLIPLQGALNANNLEQPRDLARRRRNRRRLLSANPITAMACLLIDEVLVLTNRVKKKIGEGCEK